MGSFLRFVIPLTLCIALCFSAPFFFFSQTDKTIVGTASPYALNASGSLSEDTVSSVQLYHRYLENYRSYSSKFPVDAGYDDYGYEQEAPLPSAELSPEITRELLVLEDMGLLPDDTVEIFTQNSAEVIIEYLSSDNPFWSEYSLSIYGNYLFIVQEANQGKVVQLTVSLEKLDTSMDNDALLRQYAAYLGLSGLADWRLSGRQLLSPSAELSLSCMDNLPYAYTLVIEEP
jgi:hypothetical protein